MLQQKSCQKPTRNIVIPSTNKNNKKDYNKDCEGEISLYSVSTFCLVSWVTRGIWQEAAGVELQLLHEMDLPIVTETVDVPLTQDEDVGRSMGERGHTEIQGLLSQHKYPVRLWEHTNTFDKMLCSAFLLDT